MGDYSKIEQFLDQYLLDNGIIISGDEHKLEHFMQELGKYVDDLSYLPDNGGDKLILYSGSYGESMWRYAKAASEAGEGFYYISDTEAGRMIGNPKISEKIEAICGGDQELVKRIYGDPTTNGRSPYAVSNQLSLNDRISANLASQASGNVTIWAPNGEPGKVLSDTELRHVLTNDRIPSIEKSQYFSERSGNDRPIAAKSAAKNRTEEKHFKKDIQNHLRTLPIRNP